LRPEVFVPFVIRSFGTALPKHTARQDQASDHAKRFVRLTRQRERTLQAVYRRTQIQTRSSVLFEEADPKSELESFYPRACGESISGPGTAARMKRYASESPKLAEQAARKALDRSGVTPSAVAQLITVSCTGFFAPGVDVHLIDQLGLSPSIGRTQIGFMGCHGALNGLRVARAFSESSPGSVTLLCATEICSLHFQYGWDPDSIVSNAIFADGAAALICSSQDNADGCWTLLDCSSRIVPGEQDVMTWSIGDNGFRMTLSARLPHIIERELPAFLNAWLESLGFAVSEIRSWAVHPGGPRILDAVESCLSLPNSALTTSRDIFRRHGNMSSPTILFILEQLRRENASGPCVALGFGPGLAIECALLI